MPSQVATTTGEKTQKKHIKNMLKTYSKPIGDHHREKNNKKNKLKTYSKPSGDHHRGKKNKKTHKKHIKNIFQARW